MARVEIYTTFMCGYCHRAKKLLESKGVDFEDIDVMMDPSISSNATPLLSSNRLARKQKPQKGLEYITTSAIKSQSTVPTSAS